MSPRSGDLPSPPRPLTSVPSPAVSAGPFTPAPLSCRRCHRGPRSVFHHPQRALISIVTRTFARLTRGSRRPECNRMQRNCPLACRINSPRPKEARGGRCQRCGPAAPGPSGRLRNAGLCWHALSAKQSSILQRRYGARARAHRRGFVAFYCSFHGASVCSPCAPQFPGGGGAFHPCSGCKVIKLSGSFQPYLYPT